jgi:hypothetical protein
MMWQRVCGVRGVLQAFGEVQGKQEVGRAGQRRQWPPKEPQVPDQLLEPS